MSCRYVRYDDERSCLSNRWRLVTGDAALVTLRHLHNRPTLTDRRIIRPVPRTARGSVPQPSAGWWEIHGHQRSQERVCWVTQLRTDHTSSTLWKLTVWNRDIGVWSLTLYWTALSLEITHICNSELVPVQSDLQLLFWKETYRVAQK